MVRDLGGLVFLMQFIALAPCSFAQPTNALDAKSTADVFEVDCESRLCSLSSQKSSVVAPRDRSAHPTKSNPIS